MDQKERIPDAVEFYRVVLDARMAEVWTAMPAILQSFDPAKVSCTAMVAVKGKFRNADGVVTDPTLPKLVDVPVVFPRGGGGSLTFPLAAGDEGLLVFASRNIDAWWQSGGAQKAADSRMHHLSDAFFLPGPYSQASRPSAPVATDEIQLRRDDGTVLIALSASGVRIKGDLSVTGKIDATAEVTAKAGTGDSVGLTTHTHGYDDAGSPADTAPPTGGT